MAGQDFFAFCTLLRPLQLRALGELSQVRHLPMGETIYRTGEASEILFIVNRGAVEIVEEGGLCNEALTLLSRGDVFGDVEVLTRLPRKNLARAREAVSLRAFHQKQFPELIERVPAFFRFLSERLADRLLEARDAALSHSHRLELSGNLANFDLVTIYQTIVNSSQTGELSILDEKREMFAAFFFDEGVPRGGQFQHLTGDEAFWQLFLAENLRGTFVFLSGTPRISQSIRPDDITRTPTETLITALQGRDEFQVLLAEMPEPEALLETDRADLQLEDIDPALRPVAESVWHLASAHPIQLGELYVRMSVCDLKIYQAVAELMRTGQLVLSSAPVSQKVA